MSTHPDRRKVNTQIRDRSTLRAGQHRERGQVKRGHRSTHTQGLNTQTRNKTHIQAMDQQIQTRDRTQTKGIDQHKRHGISQHTNQMYPQVLYTQQ